MFRIRGLFRTLSNIYDREYYSESCVTLEYLEPYPESKAYIQNTVEHLPWNMLLKSLYNPDIFRTLTLTFTCSNWGTETLEKGVTYVSS